MLRVVLDTNIVVSACLTPEGASATVVELALFGTFVVCVSRDVLTEYREVLARPKFFRQQERIAILLDGLEEIASCAVPKAGIKVSPDTKDNHLLECAVAARADFLVTGNRKHFPPSFAGTRIVTPREFLIELGF